MRTHTHLPIRLATLVCIGSVDLYLWRLRNVSYSLTVTCNKQSFIFVRTHWQPPLQLIYCKCDVRHYNDVTMGSMASQITSLTIVYSAVYSGTEHRKHQSSASLAIVRGIHRGPVNSPHKWPVTRKMLPFDDVIMYRQKWSDALLHLFINKKDREFMIINRTNFITALISTLWNVHKLLSNITLATCDRWHVNENMWHENACTVNGIYQFTNGTNQSEFIIWWHHCIFALLSNSNSN